MPTAAKKAAASKPAAVQENSEQEAPAPAETNTPAPTIWDRLAAPFPSDQIEKLPKAITKGGDRYQCRQGTQASADGHYCGGYHTRSIHLDYVGHAGVTMRLNDVDPTWNWEPVAFGPDGLPAFSKDGLWIRLTVGGVTRLGFGDAQGKSGPNAVKEAIGDAIRNAAMRFGVATYLWSKSEAAEAIKERGSEHDAEPAQERPQRTTSVHNQGHRTEAPGGPNEALRLTHLAAFQEDFDALNDEGKAQIKAAWPFKGVAPEGLTIEQIAAARDLIAKYRAHLEREREQAAYAPAPSVDQPTEDEPPF